MNLSPENQNDEQLIARTIAGEKEAFGMLIGKYQPRLFNAMVHFLRNPTEAEDVVQDAFILALTKLDSFKGNSQFYTWLYRIAHNAAISKLRKKRPTTSLNHGTGDESSPGFSVPDEGEQPGERIEKEEQIQSLMAAMERLSDEHRSILILREMEGMDYEAIAGVLQLPVGTVRSRLHRARGCLRELMDSMEKAK
jgi:RNA polymerase sigma-70 factor (ECF subfamily)